MNKHRVGLLAVLIVWCFFFGAGVCLEIFGHLVCWIGGMQAGGELGYGALRYEGGKFIFFDVRFDSEEVKVEAPRMEAEVSWGEGQFWVGVSLIVERPCVVLDCKWPDVERGEATPRGKRWIDWRFKCVDGNLSWPLMGLQAQMICEKTAPCQLGRFVLERGESHLEVEALEEGGGVRIEANLTRLDSSLFQPWLKILGVDAEIERGEVDGWVHLEAFQEEGIRGCAHVDAKEMVVRGLGGEAKATRALLDWDGPLRGGAGPTRVRCECVAGFLRVGNCGFQEMQGLLSYYSDLGVKWEAKGAARVGEEISPLAFSSKGFWSGHSKPWFSMDCLSSEGKCVLRGDFIDWTIDLEKVKPFWGRFAQEFFLHDPLGWALLPPALSDWEWKEGVTSCLVHWKAETAKLEHFEADMMAFQNGEIKGGYEKAVVHFDVERSTGTFSLEGLFAERELAFGKTLLASKWGASGEIKEKQIIASEWTGQIEYVSRSDSSKQPFTFPCSFSLSGGDQWLLKGQCCNYPFSLEAKQCEETWSLACKGGAYSFPHGISLEQIAGHLVFEKDGWAFDFAEADVNIGEEKLRLQAMQWMKIDDTIVFDLRAVRGFLDVFRLVGQEREGVFELDLERTEVLGERLQAKPWNWREPSQAAVCLELPWDRFLSLQPFCKALGFSLPFSVTSDFSGSILLDFAYSQDKGCIWQAKSSPLSWKGQPFLWNLRLEKTSTGWGVHIENEELRCPGAIDFSLVQGEGAWLIQEGKGEFPGNMSCLFSGRCDEKGRVQASFSHYSILSSFWKAFSPWQGKVEGKGCLSLDLSSFSCEVDGDISKIYLESESFSVKNTKPFHAFFSLKEGLMLQGIDGQISLDRQVLGECQIQLLHWKPAGASWQLAQAQFHCLEEAGAFLFKGGYITADQKQWDPCHEIDLVMDVEGTSDFSDISCFMKEGFLPFAGQLHHVYNVFLHLKGNEFSCDLQYIHQRRDVNLTLQALWGEEILGSLKLEEPEIADSLMIDWRYKKASGLAIHAIQGNLAGVNASFHAENFDTYSHLIGSAKVDFARLVPFLPLSIAGVFTELEMGKGYELKGRLQIEKLDPSRIFFQGLLSGKQAELFGYAFDTCLASIDVKPDSIQIDQLKISDPAGLFTLDRLTMGGENRAPWTFHIPLISISEFRPTLLQAVNGDPRELSPLVIRTMVFRNMQGTLEDSSTYTAEGELSFINSYKRERTIFDIPSEVLGRIIGLDIELLVPVCGKLSYVLEKGKFNITSLKEAYSQGSRSQFFLVSTPDGPTVDLDGNVQIQVKMKQYVLFKLTEAFSISIDGTLKKPQYHLQKNKK